MERVLLDVLYTHILGWLRVDDLLRVAETSKYMYTVCRNDRAWARHTQRMCAMAPEMQPLFAKWAQRTRHIKKRKSASAMKSWIKPRGHWMVWVMRLMRPARTVRKGEPCDMWGGTYNQMFGHWASDMCRRALCCAVLRLNLAVHYGSDWTMCKESQWSTRKAAGLNAINTTDGRTYRFMFDNGPLQSLVVLGDTRSTNSPGQAHWVIPLALFVYEDPLGEMLRHGYPDASAFPSGMQALPARPV